jgi:hypothetical protein
MTDTSGPIAVPMGMEGPHPHYPAGWVSPEAAVAAERKLVAEQLGDKQHQAEEAAREQAITEEIARRRRELDGAE